MKFALVVALASACLASGHAASAFTLKKSDDGSAIRWHAGKVDVIADDSMEELGPDGEAVAERALSTWLAVEGVSLPAVRIVSGDAGEVGYFKEGKNHSTIRFAPEGSPVAGGALGITVLTYDAKGVILDADVILNGGPSRPFADLPPAQSLTKEQKDSYDAQDVLTHEMGHFFGLGEEPNVPDATMYPMSGRGETKKRDLLDDDKNGIVALYSGPPDTFSSACATVPGLVDADLGALILFGIGASAFAQRKSRRRASLSILAGLAAASIFAAPARAGSFHVDVVAASSEWRGGLLVTRLDLAVPGSRSLAHAEVYGGRDGDLTQVVGHHAAPRPGDSIDAKIDGDRILIQLPPLASAHPQFVEEHP